MKNSHMGLGTLTGVRYISTTNTNNDKIIVDDNNNNTIYSKIMRIKPETFERLRSHSSRYYNFETYDTIIINLLDNFEKHNNDRR